MIRLGQHFTLEEMTRTNHEVENTPRDVDLVELTRLVCLVLDPLRGEVGAITVTSGYRSPELNRKVKGSTLSFHLRGAAADVVSQKHTPEELMGKVELLGLPYDKMIAEDNGRSQWLHIQIQPAGKVNRFKKLKAHVEDGQMVYTKA